MTWGEFKSQVESQGVIDIDEVEFIDTGSMVGIKVVRVSETNEIHIID